MAIVQGKFGRNTMTATLTAVTPIAPARGAIVTPTMLRAGILTIMTAGLIAGFIATGTEASNLAILHDGAELTRLMRFMAAIKLVIAIAGAAAVLWRLGVAISLLWFTAYAVTCTAMVAGPGLIWGMAHVGLGALLLHGGLFGTIVLVWRDPAVAARLADMVAARRQPINTRTGCGTH
jgi:hypothetical protein